MKLYRLTLCLMLALAVVVIGCSPDNVNPSGSEEPQFGAVVDTVHDLPLPNCTTLIVLPLVSNDPIFAGTVFGQCEAVNDLDNFAISYEPIPGLSVRKAALWYQVGGCDNVTTPCNWPLNGNGGLDWNKFQRFVNLNPVRPKYSINQTLSTLFQCNTYSAWCDIVSLDVNGNILFQIGVWASATPVTTEGYVFDFCSGRCPEHNCDPWLDSPNSCYGPNPPCSYPMLGPGSNLSEYDCTTGNGEQQVVVCHLPPGNPDNKQEICIAVSALPAHIVNFKPAGNQCLGHHSGCHLGPCDPCPNGDATGDSRSDAKDFFDNWNCTGSGYGGGGKGSGKGNS